MFFSVVVVFILPTWPSTTKWLSPEEKALAAARIKADRLGTVQHRMSPWKATLAALADWRTYLFTFMYMMVVGAGEHVLAFLCPLLTRYVQAQSPTLSRHSLRTSGGRGIRRSS